MLDDRPLLITNPEAFTTSLARKSKRDSEDDSDYVPSDSKNATTSKTTPKNKATSKTTPKNTTISKTTPSPNASNNETANKSQSKPQNLKESCWKYFETVFCELNIG
jgi:hypothetical protein